MSIADLALSISDNPHHESKSIAHEDKDAFEERKVRSARHCYRVVHDTTIESQDATQLSPGDAQTQTASLSEDMSRPKGILVVEDQRLLRRSLGEGAQSRGFSVWTAADGTEGVELYQQFSPRIDIVLSDVQMPGLDGPRTFEALRKINPSVRFCFMTGDTRSIMRASLLQSGALRVFEKPLSSVAQVIQELWELATDPYVLDVQSVPDLLDASCANRSLPEAQVQDLQMDGQFRRWVQASLARIAALLGPPRQSSRRVESSPTEKS